MTSTQILSGSGESAIKIYSTHEDDFPIAQVLKDAHSIGCHHIVTDHAGVTAASVGFGGELKIWKYEEGMWKAAGEINVNKRAGEPWALCLSADGKYLAGTTHDGRINVYDLANGQQKIQQFETKGSFALSVDLVRTLLAREFRARC